MQKIFPEQIHSLSFTGLAITEAVLQSQISIKLKNWLQANIQTYTSAPWKDLSTR